MRACPRRPLPPPARPTRAGSVASITTRLDAGFGGRAVAFAHTFTSPERDRERTSASTLRFLGVDELGAFLGGAGPTVEARFGGWNRSPFAERSPEIVAVARRR